MKYLSLIVLFLLSSINAQSVKSISDTTKKIQMKDSLKQIIVCKENDTLRKKPLLELKTMLTSDFYTLDKIKNVLRDGFQYENFTQEELASGLSKNQLIAYKKNKEMLIGILQKNYDDCWWYKVKSLGQLTGIPDWLIKMLQFGLLLL